ncbi:MAG: SpoIID/LytB domain-containing protein [Candidatus Firestonebacteria bacterium]
MIFKKKIILYFVFVIFSVGAGLPALSLKSVVWADKSAPTGKDNKNIVKIALITNAKSINIKVKSPYKIISGKSELDEGKSGNWDVSVSGSKIRFGQYQKDTFKIISSIITVNDKKSYRFGIIIKRNSNYLLVINELDMEEYLQGVVPCEISSKSPAEALKSQAVAARTFAHYQMLGNQNKDYQLVDTVFSQVYNGVSAERETTNKAIEDTRGEILTYNGKNISTPFFANCGGHTETNKNVWSGDCPYLISVSCKYCADFPHSTWETEISKDKIRRNLNNSNINVGIIEEIKIKSTSDSGRSKEIEIIHSKGKTILNSNKFRLAVGPSTIKSTYFTLKERLGSFIFKGRGWGHGVGMCQDGAVGMSKEGYDYKEILLHYYTGTKLAKIE